MMGGVGVVTALAVLALTGAATMPVKSTATLSVKSTATLPVKSTATVDKAQQFVDKCRSHCIAQLTPDAGRESCLEGEQCLRCWAACKAFQSDHFIRDYCKRNKACTVGCRQACQFYLGSPDQRGPVGSGQTSAGSGHTLAGSGQTLTAPPVVISLDQGPVFEPDSTVYSFVDGQRRPLDEEDVAAIDAPMHRPVEAGWRPRLAGMAFAASLVSATVSWPPRSPGGQYLVTWELLSGGLRGHLVSRETTASLPLWPDEQYSVQVFCDEGASQVLQLDTHQSQEAAQDTASDETRGILSEEPTEKPAEAAPEKEREETTVPDVGAASNSASVSGSGNSGSVSGSVSDSDSDSDSVSESAEVAASAVAASLKSSQDESNFADDRAVVLTPESPLESAALLSADSGLDSSRDSGLDSTRDSGLDSTRDSDQPTRPASLLSDRIPCGRSPTSFLAPTLLTLLALLMLLMAAGLMLAGRACLQPQKPCDQHCQQHQPDEEKQQKDGEQQQQQQRRRQWQTTEHEASISDQRTLLDRRPSPWRTSPLLQTLVDSRRAPIFVVPCHKR